MDSWCLGLAEKLRPGSGEAKQQAANILVQANQRADHLVDAAKDRAKEEAARVTANTEAELKQQTYQAQEHLRKEVVRLALLGAEKVLGQSVDKKAHETLLNKLAQELGE